MEAKDTRIYMIVDTKNIKPDGDLDDYVEFRDNRNNPNPSKDPMNFISDISIGEKVFWFGVPKEQARDTIEITDVQRKNSEDPELLKTKGKDPGNRGVFLAKVKDKYVEGLESYSIKFKIKGQKPEFEVDPKLRMEL